MRYPIAHKIFIIFCIQNVLLTRIVFPWHVEQLQLVYYVHTRLQQKRLSVYDIFCAELGLRNTERHARYIDCSTERRGIFFEKQREKNGTLERGWRVFLYLVFLFYKILQKTFPFITRYGTIMNPPLSFNLK